MKRVLLLLLLPLSIYANPAVFSERPEVLSFIDEMHKKHHLDKKYLTELFTHFSSEPKVIALMSKQYEALPWHEYQKKLITEKRIREGADFLKKHRAIFQKAEAKYHVPASVIVSILGIETQYGQVMGTFPVLQSLATLAFDYPRRASFFKSELEQFLLLAQEGSVDPLTTQGSFAGAIGMPQFMPSSYRRYAVDATQKGNRNLVSNLEDVVNSIAHYLHKHGWKASEKTVINIQKPSQALQALQTHHDLSKAECQQHHLPCTNKQKLIVLDTGNAQKSYSLGLHNFYVIMRYNNSVHYAMAIHELSEKISG